MMKRTVIFAVLLGLMICTVWVADSAAQIQKEDEFSVFFANFQKAVADGDKEKVGSLTNFNRFSWEANDTLVKVKDKAAFLKNYDSMFTPMIKEKIAKTKPTKVDKNTYYIRWSDKRYDYYLDFTCKPDEPFRFNGFTVAPA